MDPERRDLERRLAAEPGDTATAAKLVALLRRDGAEVHGPPRPPLRRAVRDELRRRALNQNDAEALAILVRDRRLRSKVARLTIVANGQREERVGLVPYSTTIPPPGQIFRAGWKAALVDHETFGDGLDAPRRVFFVNPRQDAQGRPKTGVTWFGPNLIPREWVFSLYEILVLVDAGCSLRDAEKFWNEGVFNLWLSRVPREWPVRLLMPPPRQVPTSELEFTEMLFALGGRLVSVGDEPIRLRSQEHTEVTVDCAGLERCGVSVCLLGIMSQASI